MKNVFLYKLCDNGDKLHAYVVLILYIHSYKDVNTVHFFCKNPATYSLIQLSLRDKVEKIRYTIKTENTMKIEIRDSYV